MGSLPPAAASTTRIVLVDAHAVVREGIRRVLEDEADLTVVGEAGSGEEALELVRQLRPDVVIVDPASLGPSGVELAAVLAARVPSTSVIVLWGDGEVTNHEPGDLAGAVQLSKRLPARELIAAVRAADARRGVNAAARHETAADTWWGDRLTDREREVLRLVALGLGNREIASRLGVTQRTVKFHLAQVFAKLSATSRTGAVHLARQRGWIE